jgi:ribose 5-phosphate isomerase B
MQNYLIAIGADHRGYAAKQVLLAQLELDGMTIAWIDYGTNSDERTDYPLYARPVAHAVQHKEVDAGILLCGTGVGMSIVANRYARVYAALVWNTEVAARARQEDNANLLILPADYLSTDQIQSCITAWLSASFNQERYGKRIDMIDTPATISRR